MTSSSPEDIRRDIEQTRQSLSQGVDVLNEKVNPRYIMRRRTSAARSTVSSLRDKVMGSVPSRSSETSDSGTATVHRVGQTVSSAPGTARGQAQGNPMAAGLIAFGAGWLASSLLPSSPAEQRAARAVQERANDLVEPAKEMAKDAASQLQGPAQEAVESVRSTGQDAAQQVQDEARSAKDHVQGQAQGSVQSVRSQSGS